MEELLEGRGVPHLQQRADVPLDVGPEKVPVEVGRRRRARPHAGHEAAQHQLVRRNARRPGAQLLHRKGQELQFRRAAGEGLRNRLLELRLVASREDEAPVARAVRVHADLDPGEQLRDALHLVDHKRFGMHLEERLRILRRERAQIRVLQIDVGVPGKQRSDQRRLARLPWPEKRHDGILLRRLEDFCAKMPFQHGSCLLSEGEATTTWNKSQVEFSFCSIIAPESPTHF